MNNFFKQLNTEAQNIRMTHAERSLMKERLLAEMHGLTPSPFATPSPYFSFVMPAWPVGRPRVMVPALVLVLIVVGGGAAYAAEGALPGDLLYPVKVNINEPVRSALAFSDESKADVHAALAVRRMQEAETLAADGQLTVAAKAELATNFDAQASEVQRIAAVVEEKDPVAAADISARFASNVAAHGAVIARLGLNSKDTTTRRESGDLAVRFEKHGQKVASANPSTAAMHVEGASAIAGGIAKFAAPSTLAPTNAARVEDTDDVITKNLTDKTLDILAETDVQLHALSNVLGASTTARVQLRISDVRDRAEGTHAEGDAATARCVAAQALTDASTIRAFLQAQQRAKTDILPQVFDLNDGAGGAASVSQHKDEKHGQHDIVPVSVAPTPVTLPATNGL